MTIMKKDDNYSSLWSTHVDARKVIHVAHPKDTTKINHYFAQTIAT